MKSLRYTRELRELAPHAAALLQKEGEWADEDINFAYYVAESAGYGRLLGVAIGEDEIGAYPIHPKLATAAAQDAIRLIGIVEQDLFDLPNNLDEAEGEEGEMYVADILQCRMDLHASLIAIDESFEVCRDRKDSELENFQQVFTDLLLRLGKLDEKLYASRDLLSLVTGTHLLSNWRAMVEPGIGDGKPLPWWLDGTLEAETERVRQEAARAPFPSPCSKDVD